MNKDAAHLEKKTILIAGRAHFFITRAPWDEQKILWLNWFLETGEPNVLLFTTWQHSAVPSLFHLWVVWCDYVGGPVSL